MSGKVNYGETVLEAAQRELKEETSLKGIPVVRSIRHYRVFDKTNTELVEDKLMFYCAVENPIGELKHGNEGKYEWVKQKDLLGYVTNHFESIDRFKSDIKEVSSKGKLKFTEIEHTSDKF